MRKLYTLVTGFLFSLVMKTTAQDAANFTYNLNETNNVGISNFTVSDEKTGAAANEETCQADFEVSPTTVSPLTKKFTAIPWHSEQNRPIYICWKFGDGKDTCIQYTNTYPDPYAVAHTYEHPGNYEVCVRIVYQGGCDASKCKTVSVEETCHADFERVTLSPTVNPMYVTFKAIPSNSGDKKPKRICWRFGDGKDTCIEYSESYTGSYLVRHKYREAGNYEVCIKITYFGGCEAYKCKQVLIGRPDSCRADFERLPYSTINHPLTVYLKALPWHNNYKKPKKICWNFGDGRDTCIEYPENYTGSYIVRHIYHEPGYYNVCVKITYYGGCEAYKCKYLLVGRPDQCRADFQRIPVENADYPLAVGLKALPWNSNNKKPKLICWSFGDGRDTCVEYAQNFSGPYVIRHRYEHPGTYNVCVKITYYGGCEAYKCKPVIVQAPDECRADFEKILVNTISNPLTVYYKALPWHNNDKKPKKICWIFGDGKDTCIEYSADYTGPYAVRHTYHEPGNYEVCVNILYYGGCEARLCKEIRIGEADCRADFERIPITTNTPLTAGFRALPWSINNNKPQVICWRFGDGKDTCIEYPENYTGPYVVSHTYNHSGQYEVCVKIKYYGGCEAYKCNLITIEAPPDACRVNLFEITPSITSLIRGFYAVPWHNNNKRPVLVCWYFGDGTDTCIELNEANPLPTALIIRHTYPGPGVYKACVKVMFQGGCIAYDCDEVVIRPATNVCGGYMTDSLISPRTFRFRAFPIHNPDDPVTSIVWSFGDGTGAMGPEVTHIYNYPGTFEVCVTIKTLRGCVTHICKPLIVPGNEQSVLQLTPNPVITVLHVLFYSTHTEPVNIKIVNANGVIVRNYVRNASMGSNNWDLDLATLLPGVYTLVVQSPNQLSSAIFIKT